MKIRYLYFLLIFLTVFGCSTSENKEVTKPENTQREKVIVSNTSTQNSNLTSEANQKEDVKNANVANQKVETKDDSACQNLTQKGFLLDKKQTFPIDFKPFEKSCFVTFHDPEFSNPPLGSQFFVYKNGQEIFNFPDQFNGGNTTCWVESVAFEDINDDSLKDILIVGKCGAKSEAYNENMVYLNTGKDFVTNVEANVEMLDFTKVSQIKDYVKKNQPMFSK